MPDDLIVSQTTLARAFSVSDRTVRRWEAEGLDAARVDKDGQAPAYDLSAAIAWLLERERTRAATVTPPGDAPPLEVSRARKEAALARIREIEAAEREGRVLTIEDHDNTLAAIAVTIRSLDRRADFLRELADLLGLERPRDAVPAARACVRAIYAQVRRLAGDPSDGEGAPNA